MTRYMKSFVIAATVAFVMAMGPEANAQETLAIGASMPLADKALPATDGTTKTMASVKGTAGTLVVFWCNTCPWVKRYRQAADKGYDFPYVSDPGSLVALAFGAKRTPQAFLFNSNNVLAYQGAFDDSPSDEEKVEAAYLEDAIQAVLAGSDVALAETKAFGCTIKFQ